MARSVWKGPFVDANLLKRVQKLIEAGSSNKVVTKCRGSTILPFFVGFIFDVYNGKKYIPVSVSEEMVGKKFGEFSPTRTFYGHGADKKVNRGNE